ncbi:hypothetical protein RI367_005854 [Sorochytrium milnesiophthora]
MSHNSYNVLMETGETSPRRTSGDDGLAFRTSDEYRTAPVVGSLSPTIQHGQPILGNQPSATPISPTPAAPQPPQNYSFWNVEYYAHYFDIDTNDVLQRTLAAVLPTPKFVQAFSEHVDMYGPFWVPTTVIFLLFVTSSISASIRAYINVEPYQYNFTTLSVAVTTVYVYVFAVPFLSWGLGWYYSKRISLIELWGTYGYGTAIWIPVTLICIVPIDLVRWAVVAAAFFLSAMCYVRNVNTLMTTSTTASPTILTPAPLRIMLLGVFCMHIAFAVLLKVYFFSY